MITPAIKETMRRSYRCIRPRPATPDAAEQAAIRVIARLDERDVLDLARPSSADRLNNIIKEITA
jgi:hypothetical protein